MNKVICIKQNRLTVETYLIDKITTSINENLFRMGAKIMFKGEKWSVVILKLSLCMGQNI